MDERFSRFPSPLAPLVRLARLGPGGIPALLIHPDWGRPAPFALWLHGRTANKELDSGRYLRWVRAGIAACAIDLPGHGERADPTMQTPRRTPELLTQTIAEIDEVVDAVTGAGFGDYFDRIRCAPDEASRQTAGAIAAVTGAKFRVLDSLAEPSMGLWEGQLLADLEERFPSVYRHWRTDPQLVVPPEGESLQTAQQRICAAISRAAAKFAGGDESIGVVLRPIGLALLRCTLKQRPIADVWDLIESESRLEWVSVQPAHLRRGAALEKVQR